MDAIKDLYLSQWFPWASFAAAFAVTLLPDKASLPSGLLAKAKGLLGGLMGKPANGGDAARKALSQMRADAAQYGNYSSVEELRQRFQKLDEANKLVDELYPEA